MTAFRTAAVLVVGSLLGAAALAQSIYTCVDSRGRKLTSDRPIAECIDREQLELNSSGTVRRKIGPSLTAPEQAALEKKQREEALAKARLEEEKRRDRALLTRYPNKSVHDQERRDALAQVDVVIEAARHRLVTLQKQRADINTELEFYKGDPARAPASLQRQLEDNTQATAIQNRFIADQEEEKRRINARFDEDLQRLRQLWALSGAPAGTSGR